MPGQSKHQSEFWTGSPFRQKAILSMIDEAKEEMEDGEVERQKREECSTSNNSTPAGGGHESPAMNDSQFSQIPLKHSVLEVVLVLYFAGLADDQ